jgi:DNA-binding phage protein
MSAPRAASKAARADALRAALAQLGGADLGSTAAATALRDALASGEPALIIAAAGLIEAHALGGFDAALATAYRALAAAKATADPACLAKEALVRALDAVEHPDEGLFAAAASLVQIERAKGVARDTAGRVRAHGVLGLARVGHRDALPIFGARLADREPAVRLAAARAVAHHGARDGAGLLLLKLGVGDAVAEIAVECLRGLFALAPDLAEPHARAMLDGDGRQLALHALGTVPDERAVAILAEVLEVAALAHERAEVIHALGLSRRPRARAILIDLVIGDRSGDAQAALTALAIHKDDPRVAAEVRAATAALPELAARVAALFPDA